MPRLPIHKSLTIVSLVLMLMASTAYSDVIKIENDNEHNIAYEKGSNLIFPNIKLLDKEPDTRKKALKEVQEGILILEAVTEYNPANWAAYWIKGKGYQVLGDHQSSYKEFRSSYVLQQSNPDVAREFAASCLELGYGEEAKAATLHAISLSPDDAGLYANLALAYLILGKNDDAKTSIDKSLEMSPRDKISKAVKKLVNDVIKGKKDQPKKMSDFY